MPGPLNSPYGIRPDRLPNQVPGQGRERAIAEEQIEAAESVQPSAGGSSVQGTVAQPQAIGAMGSPPVTPDAVVEGEGQGTEIDEQTRTQAAQLVRQLGLKQQRDSRIEAAAGQTAQTAQQWAQQMLGAQAQAAEVRESGPGEVYDPYQLPFLSPEVSTAIRTSFASASPNELSQVARESGLYEEVWTTSDGRVMTRRPGQKNPEEFSQSFFGAAEALQVGTEMAAYGRLLQLTGKAIPHPLAKAVVTAAGAAIMSKSIRDATGVAMGIERDPERDVVKEQGFEAGLAAGLQGATNMLSGRLGWATSSAQRLAGNGMKRMKETIHQTEDFLRTLNESVETAGIQFRDGGSKITLGGQHYLGDATTPELAAETRLMLKYPAFREWMAQISDNVSDAYMGITRTLARQARGHDLPKDVALTIDTLRTAEGSAVRNLRGQINEEARGQRFSADAMGSWKRQFDEVTQVARGSDGNLSWESLHSRVAGLTENEAKKTVAALRKGEALNRRGTLSLEDIDTFRRDIQPLVDTGMRSNDPAVRSAIEPVRRMRDALTDDYIEIAEGVVGPEVANLYRNQVASYRELMEATRGMTKSLVDGGITAQAFVHQLTRGPNAKQNVMNLKNLLSEADPELWGRISGSYFDDLFMRVGRADPERVAGQVRTDVAGKDVNWTQMQKAWTSIHPEVRKELAGGIGLDTKVMDAAISVGRRVQQAGSPAEVAQHSVGLLRSFAVAMTGNEIAQGSLRVRFVTRILEGMGAPVFGPQQNMAQWLAAGGVEDVIRRMPGANPSVVSNLRTFAQNYVPSETMGRTASVGIRSTAQGMREQGALTEEELRKQMKHNRRAVRQGQ